MLRLFFLDPNSPCMNIIGPGALEEGCAGECRSNAREIRGTAEYALRGTYWHIDGKQLVHRVRILAMFLLKYAEQISSLQGSG